MSKLRQGSFGTLRVRFAHVLAALWFVTLVGWNLTSPRSDQQAYGPFGPEGARLREQLWILPSGEAGTALRGTVFRPDGSSGLQRAARGDGALRRHPLVIINHGTDESTREAIAMPVFYWLSRWFVERGYVVVLPQRRGHGATGGELAEGRDNCNNPDHLRAGNVAADDVEAVLRYMSSQPFVDSSQIVVVGISTGGWASLALAARNPKGLAAVVNFAGGRGGYAGGRPNRVCAPERLIAAAGAFAHTARIPTLWLYSRNDSYFGPELATAMAGAWTENGGSAELHVLPPYGKDGHTIADDQAGWRLWGAQLERFLQRNGSGRAEHAAASPGKL
jgi:dienelactone hydrolase